MAAVALMAMLVSPPALAGDALSARELAELFPGRFEAVVENYQVRFDARTDGTLVGSVLGASDTGRWSVNGGRLCIRLESWMEGRSRCSIVVEESGWYEGSGVRFRKL